MDVLEPNVKLAGNAGGVDKVQYQDFGKKLHRKQKAREMDWFGDLNNCIIPGQFSDNIGRECLKAMPTLFPEYALFHAASHNTDSVPFLSPEVL